MLVGAYPFEDPEDPRNFRKTLQVSKLINTLFSIKCPGVIYITNHEIY